MVHYRRFNVYNIVFCGLEGDFSSPETEEHIIYDNSGFGKNGDSCFNSSPIVTCPNCLMMYKLIYPEGGK